MEQSTDFKQKLQSVLRRHEGYEKFPYKCTAGKTTIGIGHNLDDNGLPDHIIQALFEYDIEQIANELSDRLEFFERLPETIQIVLLDMAFNLGVPRLMKFKKMLRFAELGEWFGVYQQMLDSKWAKQVGHRADDLSKMVLSLTTNNLRHD